MDELDTESALNAARIQVGATMKDDDVRAWIFLSVSDTGSRLPDVIGKADDINHTLPTRDELAMSLGWLRAQKLIAIQSGMYVLSGTGRALLDDVRASRTSKFDVLDATKTRLSTLADLSFEPEPITDGDVRSATDAYRREFRRAYRELSRRDPSG